LNLKANYLKFKKHLETGGLFYAFWRGVKYFIFLIKIGTVRKKTFQVSLDTIEKGKIKIFCSGSGVKLYWNGVEVTKGVGLSVGINTLGIWTDSTKANWEVLERHRDYFRLKVKFKNIPLSQIWSLKIKSHPEISWLIDMELQKDMEMEESHIVCLASDRYKSWVNDHKEGSFPSAKAWQDIVTDPCSRFVGLRFPKETLLPGLGLEFSDKPYRQIYSLIQNTPPAINARVIGTKIVYPKDKNYYLSGKYRFFSGKIILFEDEASLERKRISRNSLRRSFVYLIEKVISFNLKKTIGYCFVRRKDFLRRTIKIKLSQDPLGLFKRRAKSTYKLIYKKIKSAGFIPFVKELKNNYLDIIGIFSERFALKGPHSVQIDLTNKCNDKRRVCGRNFPLLKEERNNEQVISYEKAIALINTLKRMGTKEIYLSGDGEPFMHPQILKIIEYIKTKGLVCYLNTNFTLINEEMIYELVKLKVDYLIVNLWASSCDRYTAIHLNKDSIDFYRIEQMLKILNQIKEQNPYVCITNVIFNQNWQDIEDMVNFALTVKAEGINFAVMNVIPEATDILLLNQVQRKEVLLKINNIIKNKNIKDKIDFLGIETFIKRLSNPYSDAGDYDKDLIDNIPCYTGWLFSRILANGDVNACFKAPGISMGNIYIDDFNRIWNSQRQQEFRNLNYLHKNKETGCYRGCDAFKRNVSMHRQINSLFILGESLFCWGARIFVSIKKRHSDKSNAILENL